MSRPMYNGRTAAEWFQIWQEDTDALQRKVAKLQQELSQATDRANIYEEWADAYRQQLENARDPRPKGGVEHPETAYD